MIPAFPGTRSQLDRWIDLAWLLCIPLLWGGAKAAAALVVVAWLVVRLLLAAPGQALTWPLLVLALVNAGVWVFERDRQPSGASDLLLVVLAFAAGHGRTPRQWLRSLRWVALLSLPLLAMGLAYLLHPWGEILRFPGYNVNRLSFLLGFPFLASASWAWRDQGVHRLGWLALALGDLGLALLSGSRAGLVSPLLALGAALLLLRWRRGQGLAKRWWAAMAAGLASAGGLALHWYTAGREGPINSFSDINRFQTALCWAQAPLHAEQGVLLGVGFGKVAARQCGPDQLAGIKAIGLQQGLPHAHNLFAQVFAETGLLGLVAAVGVAAWVVAQVWNISRPQAWPEAGGSALPLFLVSLAVYLGINAFTTSYLLFLPLNQVLIGFGLAAFGLEPGQGPGRGLGAQG